MGSATQIGVGVLILGAAFLFGHYVHQKSLNESAEAQAPEDDIEWQSQQQIEELRRRINLTDTVAPPEQSKSESEEPPQSKRVPKSSMPIAGMNRSPVVRKNTSDDLSLPTEAGRAVAPDVPAELPPILSETNPLNRDGSSTAESILQPDFSMLAEDRQPAFVERSEAASTGREFTSEHPDNASVSIVGESHDGGASPSQIKNHFAERPQMAEPPKMAERPKSDAQTKPGRNLAHASMEPFATTGQLTSDQRSNLQPIGNSKTVTVDAPKYLKYQTRLNDTLQDISIRYFGKPDYYLDIYIANRAKLESPVKVPSNIELRIPVYPDKN